MNKSTIDFKPVTGLDVAKLLGDDAVSEYEKSVELQTESKKRMKKQLDETKEMFKKLC